MNEEASSALKKLVEILIEQAGDCRQVLLAHQTPVEALVGPVLLGACSSASGIAALLALGQVRNAMILSRALTEACVTAAYLRSADDEVRSSYAKFTIARQHRAENSEVALSSFHLTVSRAGAPSPSNSAILKDAIDLFTGPKGGAKTRWTSLSLQKQLQVVEDAGIIDISPHAFALLALYDEASEALHGTLYGAINHFGLTEGRRDAANIERHLALTAVSVTAFCSRMLSATVAKMGEGEEATAAHARMTARDSEVVEHMRRFVDEYQKQ